MRCRTCRWRWKDGRAAVLSQAQQRQYGYVHIPKKRTPHLLGFGSEWRKCFVVHPHAQTSRALESYQWLTGSVLKEGLPANLSRADNGREKEVAWLEERVMAAVTEHREDEWRRRLQGKKGVERVRRVLSSALTGLWMSGEEHLQTSSLTSDPSIESFWRCEGSNFLSISHPLFILHCTQPLDLFTDPTLVYQDTVPFVDHHPRHLGLFEHSFDQITPFAGCHRFSPTPFTHTVFCAELQARSQEQLLAHGLLQLFCQAAAECVQNGYSLEQDLVYPLASQGVVTNGHQLTFLSYQLNTMDLKKSQDSSKRRNVLWVGPTLDLFSKDGVNRECSELLVQVIMHRPARRRPSVSGFWLKKEAERKSSL